MNVPRRDTSWNREHTAAVERARALLALEFRYGDFFSIAYADDLYRAARIGTGRVLAAGTSSGLGELIMCDLLAYPVLRHDR